MMSRLSSSKRWDVHPTRHIRECVVEGRDDKLGEPLMQGNVPVERWGALAVLLADAEEFL
jgi:hypothetical protein